MKFPYLKSTVHSEKLDANGCAYTDKLKRLLTEQIWSSTDEQIAFPKSVSKSAVLSVKESSKEPLNPFHENGKDL